MKEYIAKLLITLLGVLVLGNQEPEGIEIETVQQVNNTPIAGVLLDLTWEETEICTVEMTDQELEVEKYYDSLELLAICVEAEAGNQSIEGKRLVADVILNRVDDPDFPDNITDVVTQYLQFSSYWDGGMEKVVEPSVSTFEAVQMELEERSYPSLLYFREGEWPDYGTHWKKVGDHYFCTK